MEMRGRPTVLRLFRLQYRRHAVRCQRITVSGFTRKIAERQPGQRRLSHDRMRRSAGCSRRRRDERASTAS
jgi:hypothetical protein